jgi:hypothetical protein
MQTPRSLMSSTESYESKELKSQKSHFRESIAHEREREREHVPVLQSSRLIC